MFSGRKGISPLIATVVLIAFAVALGAVIMSMVPPLFPKNETAVKGCDGVSLELQSVGGSTQLKIGGSGKEGYIEVTLKNMGSVNIDGLKIWINGEKKIYKEESKELIEPGYPLVKKIPYDFDAYGKLTRISFTPLATLNKKPVVCPRGAIEFEVE